MKSPRLRTIADRQRRNRFRDLVAGLGLAAFLALPVLALVDEPPRAPVACEQAAAGGVVDDDRAPGDEC
jgi:hypothetical protein